MNENWKAVPDYEGFYEVSDQGRVRSLDRTDNAGRKLRGRLLRPGGYRPGKYLSVNLCKNGKDSTFAVHRLVLESFVHPAPEGMEACHNNNDPYDNRLENLRWDTHAENMREQLKFGTHAEAAKTHCKNGHTLTGSNVRVDTKYGRRVCRACKHDYYERNKDTIRAKERARYWAKKTENTNGKQQMKEGITK